MERSARIAKRLLAVVGSGEIPTAQNPAVERDIGCFTDPIRLDQNKEAAE